MVKSKSSLEIDRRKALERLGLGISVAYVTPLLLSLRQAAAQEGGEGGEGGEGEGDGVGDGEGGGGDDGAGEGGVGL